MIDSELVVWWDGRKDGRNGGLLCCAEPERAEDTCRPIPLGLERGAASVEILKALPATVPQIALETGFSQAHVATTLTRLMQRGVVIAVRGPWGTRTVYQRVEDGRHVRVSTRRRSREEVDDE